MASRFKKMIRAFGLTDAIKLYLRVKFRPYGNIFIHRYQTSFFLRKNTSDYYTFDQVFLRDQYNFKFPFDIKTIIDAGANNGMAAVYFSKKYPQAKIISIEPSAENFSILENNIRDYSNITAFCKGVWNKDVHLKIINTDGVKNAFMVAETTSNDPNGIPAISIETIQREQGWPTIDLLKIDIEGSEKEVFELGYEKWLPTTKAIVIELHDFMKKGCAQSFFKAISQYDFSFDMRDENLIMINEAYREH
jgi:FkbM family methyltransferase